MVTLAYDKTSFAAAEAAILADPACNITKNFRAQAEHSAEAFIWDEIAQWLSSLGTGYSAILASTVTGQRSALAKGVVAVIRETKREESFDGFRSLDVPIAIIEPLAVEFLGF